MEEPDLRNRADYKRVNDWDMIEVRVCPYKLKGHLLDHSISRRHVFENHENVSGLYAGTRA